MYVMFHFLYTLQPKHFSILNADADIEIQISSIKSEIKKIYESVE